MTTNTDRYLTNEHAATDFSFPYTQALRGENPAQCGYFVPLTQMEKAGWRVINPESLIEYSYNSGKTEVGMLLKKPRMALTPICQLGMYDRKASQDEETLVVIGKWDRKYLNENVGTFQIYLVMFFDENKQPLHDIPLKLTAKGAQQATLSDQWQRFCIAVARCQAKASNIMFRPRGVVYNALCLFQPHIIRKNVGDKIKSPACYVDGYVNPTVDNWQDFFLGTDDDLADAVVGMMNPQPRLLLPDPTPGTFVMTPAPVAQPQILQSQSVPSVGTAPAIPQSGGFSSRGFANANDNSNAIDVASSPVAQESTPVPTSSASAATETKPAPEPEYIDPPEFEEDEFEEDEVEEDRIPF
jgi:Family of unknown function (DUF5895)